MSSPLDGLRVARPCPAMVGGDRIRHCSLCRLNVCNLSEMTEEEALALVRDSKSRRCVRFYRRADGTVLTRECPGRRPLSANRAQKALLATALAGALMASDAAVDAGLDAVRHVTEAERDQEVVMGDVEWVEPVGPAPLNDALPVMGMPLPPPPPPPPPGP